MRSAEISERDHVQLGDEGPLNRELAVVERECRILGLDVSCNARGGEVAVDATVSAAEIRSPAICEV